MIKKIIKIQEIKILHLGTFKMDKVPFFKLDMGMVLYLGEEDEGSLSEGGGQGSLSGRVE